MIIDLHSHILPYVDDGAGSMEEALEMVRMAAQSGVEVIVATPHANQRGKYENYATAHMEEIFRSLCEHVRRRRIPIRILPGMEIFASPDMIELIKAGRLRPMPGTSVFLVEFPFACPQEEMEYLLSRMLSEGMTPLLAHPERYYCVQDDVNCVGRFRSMGCYIQVNKGSVLGRLGPRGGETAGKLLQLGLVDVIGSDAHGAMRRTARMDELNDYLVRHCGQRTADMLLGRNPEKLLTGKSLPRESWQTEQKEIREE